MASISQGIYKRFQLGNASNANAEIYGAVTAITAEKGWSAAKGELEPKIDWSKSSLMDSTIKAKL